MLVAHIIKWESLCEIFDVFINQGEGPVHELSVVVGAVRVDKDVGHVPERALLCQGLNSKYI